MTADPVADVKTALTAFETGMKAFDAFKSEIAPKIEKMDAFEAAKFTKMSEDIGKAIELSQKEAGARKALEDQTKAQDEQLKKLDTELKALEIAFNRAPSASTDESKSKELAAKRTKIFNEFARSKGKVDFDDFVAQKAESDPELKALSLAGNADATGGYLIRPEFGGVIQARAFETSPIRQLATVTTIGTDSLEVVTDNDEASAGWVGETTSRTATNAPTLGKITIPVNELYAYPEATQKMLEDPVMDIEAWLGEKIADIFARTEATAFVSGNGVMKPKGILSYDAGTTLSSSQIEQIVTGSASAFTYDGLVNLQNAVKEEYQPNAVFLIKRATNAYLMQIKRGDGTPIFNMTFDKNVGLRPTIMGKDVWFANDMPIVTTNALAAAYGDIRRAYQVVDRRGITVLRDPFTRKPYIGFYSTKRVGGGVVNFEAIKLQKVALS